MDYLLGEARGANSAVEPLLGVFNFVPNHLHLGATGEPLVGVVALLQLGE
jgi:hypothetical protein